MYSYDYTWYILLLQLQLIPQQFYNSSVLLVATNYECVKQNTSILEHQYVDVKSTSTMSS